MSDKKLTIFQRLGQVIGPDSAKLKNVYNQPQRFNIGKELLKTTDKREYELAKLQAQQNKYLSQMWKKVENGLYQQSINYETTRIGSYADFEAMEFYPIIAAALDIIMEEATTVNDKGKVLNVYSESNRVKTILQDLFFNRLDMHTSLPMWTRNTPIRENSIIPLLDGTEITIKELSNRVKNGEEVWSYAIQDVTKAIVPSKIVWCDLTRRNSELYRVTLDDGTYIDTTPDHEYMLRDGSFKRADELTEGQSLMPFYTKTSVENYGKLNGYEKIYNPSSDKYEYTHRIIAKNCLIDSEKEKISGEKWLTHHINFKKRDNNPNNLKRMSFNEHSNLHEKLSKNLNEYRKKPEVIKKRLEGIDKYLRSDKRKKRLSEEMSGVYPKFFELYNNSDLHTEHNEIRSNKMLVNWSNKDFIKKTKKGMTIEISHACLNYISNIIINNQNYIGINKLAKLLKTDQEFINLLKETYTLRKDITKSINTTTLNKLIFRKTNKNYFEFVFSIKPEIILDKEYLKCKAIFEGKTKTKVINHKVISVIKLNETADVYCLEAVGPNGEHDRHNFPVCGFDSNSSYSRTSGVFLSNCKYGDNFVFLNVNDKHGIIGAKQMPNYEMERRESGLFDMISGSHSVNNNVPNSDKVKFYWRGRDVEFNSWQMAHFRLLGDDRRLPYGTSILEKARRIWKQLILAEDSMLVYRVTRAPERRVYKIYVGNIDDADVPAYVNEIADRFKRTPIIDSQTGQMDLRFNQLSNDQDFFIPVRSEDAPNPIDTLPGASNLDQIADIEYLRNNLFTALRIPKPFLGFDETSGEGKNLALQDIRFSRTVNRVQQSMLQELNKIAIIHLYLLGFEDDLDNFSLTLNNPSTQAEMLKIEHLQQKITLLKDAVSDIGNGFGTMSWTRAHREILGWSNDEIKKDLLEQRMEKAASGEIANTANVIKHTGMFDDVDKIYGDYEAALKGGGEAAASTETATPSFGGGGGGGLGGGLGGTTPETPEGGETPELGGETGGETPEGGEAAAPEAPAGGEASETLTEGLKLITEEKKLLTNKLVNRTNKYKNRFVDLIESVDGLDVNKKMDNIKIIDKNVKINNDINQIINEIDKMLDE